MRHFLDVFDDGRSEAALADALVDLYSKDTLLEHWSRERLRTPEARAGWVEPDRAPLPRLAAETRQDQRWLDSLSNRVAAVPASAPRRELARTA